MSSSLRRGTLAATALTLSVVTLSACGAGNSAQTSEVKPDNAAATAGDIKIQNVNIVTAPGGSGPATVTGRIFNDGAKPEVLQGITVSGTAKAKLSPAKGEQKVTVPAGGSLALGGKDNAAALLSDAKKAGVSDGNAQPVTFDLSGTGAVNLHASVVPATHHWKDAGPTVQPSAGSPSESPSESASGKPSEPAGGEPSGAASAEQQGGGEHSGH